MCSRVHGSLVCGCVCDVFATAVPPQPGCSSVFDAHLSIRHCTRLSTVCVEGRWVVRSTCVRARWQHAVVNTDGVGGAGGCNETGVVVSSKAIRSWDGTLADGTSAVSADRMSGFAFQSQIPPLSMCAAVVVGVVACTSYVVITTLCCGVHAAAVASQSGEPTVLYRSCDGSVGVNSGPANTGFAVSVGTAQFWSQHIMTQAESLQQCRAKSLGAPALTATQFLIRFAINNVSCTHPCQPWDAAVTRVGHVCRRGSPCTPHFRTQQGLGAHRLGMMSDSKAPIGWQHNRGTQLRSIRCPSLLCLPRAPSPRCPRRHRSRALGSTRVCRVLCAR